MYHQLSIVLFGIFFCSFSQEFDKLTINTTNPWPQKSNERIRIVTQSCSYQHFKPNLLWQYMVVLKPDLITLLGDTVYLDAKPTTSCNNNDDISCFNYEYDEVKWYEDPITQYDVLLNSSDFSLTKKYQNFSSWPVPVLPTWDDHDYCFDGSDSTCKYKNLTKEAYLYFFRKVDNHTDKFDNIIDEIESKIDGGIYYYFDYSKTFSNNKMIKLRFYMFDERWYRTGGDMLGDEQKEWFTDLIFYNNSDDINYHIIGSGSSYFTTFSVAESLAENWNPTSKEWLWNVTEEAGISDRLIILSGDVHFSAIYRNNRTFEFVTSAMTHGVYDSQAWAIQEYEESGHRLVSDVINEENIGVLDLGIDGYEFTYISKYGGPLINVSYNYTNNIFVYDVLNKKLVETSFIGTLLFWVVIGISFCCFSCYLISIIICYKCFKHKKNKDEYLITH